MKCIKSEYVVVDPFERLDNMKILENDYSPPHTFFRHFAEKNEN